MRHSTRSVEGGGEKKGYVLFLHRLEKKRNKGKGIDHFEHPFLWSGVYILIGGRKEKEGGGRRLEKKKTSPELLVGRRRESGWEGTAFLLLKLSFTEKTTRGM